MNEQTNTTKEIISNEETIEEINENSNLKLGKQKKIYLCDRGGGQYLEEKNNTGLPVYQENAAKEDKTIAAKKKTSTKKKGS